MDERADLPPGALRDRYRSGVVTALATLDRLRAQLADAPTDAALVESIRREVHRLHGSAGSYGFARACELAGSLERRLIRWTADARADQADRADLVAHFIDAFRASVESAPADAAAATGAAAGAPAVAGMVAAVGVDAGYVSALEVEAALRGMQVTTIAADRARALLDATSNVRAVVTTPAGASALPAGLRAPVFMLTTARERGAAEAVRGTGSAAIPVRADDPPGRLLDLVEQLEARGDHGGARVLVVDDDPAMLALVTAVATGDGFEVVTRESAQGLTETVAREMPSIVLLDVQLDGMSGIDATRALRAVPANRDLPILLYSGNTDATTRGNAFAAGADGVLAKPVVPAELRQRLRDQLERRRLRRMADGMHPYFDLTVPPRTMRDAASVWAARDAQSIVVVRAVAGTDEVAWHREAGRLAVALRGGARAIGLLDSDAVLALVVDSPEDAVRRITALRAQGAPGLAWFAGVASVDDGGASLDRAMDCAADAITVAMQGDSGGVRRWQPADRSAAPDVVIVEDDAALSEMLQYALQQGGYTYRAFADGDEAYRALSEMRTGHQRPVVLLDLDLPGMDGHSLHERLRVERPGVFVVVVISVHTGEGDQVRALNSGAWDYITKPLNVRVLMAKLAVWMARVSAEL